jgi:hypothetical protein
MASATCIKCLCESHAAAVSEGGEIEQCTWLILERERGVKCS